MTGYKERQLQRAYEAIQAAGQAGLTRGQVAEVLGLRNGTQVHQLMLELAGMGLIVCDRSPTLPRAPMVYYDLAAFGGQ
jgi:chromosome segregation and condensation protein ScpB